jgi:iron complex transport system substrate-binding protein
MQVSVWKPIMGTIIIIIFLAIIILGLRYLIITGKFLAASPITGLKIPADPQRIISLSPSVTEIIFALGQGHRLQGVAQYSDFPPAAKSLPRIGSFQYLNVERIISLQPDLAIGVQGNNSQLAMERLEGLHIPVYAAHHNNLEELFGSILAIGQLMGVSSQAEELVENLRRRINRVKSLVDQTSHHPKVFFQISNFPIVSAGDKTFINEMITLAGGQNLAAAFTGYPRFSYEQILSLQPDIIIATSMAGKESFAKVQADWQRWPQLPAVQNQRLYVMDSDLVNRSGPRLVEGLELLYCIIHPELSGGKP